MRGEGGGGYGGKSGVSCVDNWDHRQTQETTAGIWLVVVYSTVLGEHETRGAILSTFAISTQIVTHSGTYAKYV